MTQGPCKGSSRFRAETGTSCNESQSIFSLNEQKNHGCSCTVTKDYPRAKLTPGQTCSISVLTTVFTGSWLPNQYCRLRYTTPQLGHSITYLQKKMGYPSEILEVECTRQCRDNREQRSQLQYSPWPGILGKTQPRRVSGSRGFWHHTDLHPSFITGLQHKSSIKTASLGIPHSRSCSYLTT